ncbi:MULTISPECIES: hypothetical protein [unclassified Isoptericola]|uniref:hypothetical protein n=1 Tax=unclassified Isoptericola TaxID=2623355 RepID=UPI0036539D09
MTRQHILRAIEEYDDRGRDAFVGVYGFTPTPAHTFEHDERTYDSKAVLGVAHKYATGVPARPEDLVDAKCDDAAILRKHGFVAYAPAAAAAAAAAAPARKTVAPRRKAASAPARKAVVPEPELAICPTCFTALPATGICDECD